MRGNNTRNLPPAKGRLQRLAGAVLQERNVIHKIGEENVVDVIGGRPEVILPTHIRIGNHAEVARAASLTPCIIGFRVGVSHLVLQVTLQIAANRSLQGVVIPIGFVPRHANAMVPAKCDVGIVCAAGEGRQ